MYLFFLFILFELLDEDYCFSFSVSALRLIQKPHLHTVGYVKTNAVRLITKGIISLLSLHSKDILN